MSLVNGHEILLVDSNMLSETQLAILQATLSYMPFGKNKAIQLRFTQTTEQAHQAPQPLMVLLTQHHHVALATLVTHLMVGHLVVLAGQNIVRMNKSPISTKTLACTQHGLSKVRADITQQLVAKAATYLILFLGF